MLLLIAAVMLVSGASALSIPFMLGVDILIVVGLMSVMVFVVVLFPKPDSYYCETKKYSLQENYRTEEALNNNPNFENEKEASKAKLNFLNESDFKVENID